MYVDLLDDLEFDTDEIQECLNCKYPECINCKESYFSGWDFHKYASYAKLMSSHLTDRQMIIVEGIASGMNDMEIAAEYCIHANTVQRIRRKLGVPSIPRFKDEAVRVAYGAAWRRT